MLVSAGAYATLIRTTARKLDTPIPPPFDNALAEAQALRESTERIEGSAGAINQRIINCLREGKDWHTDKTLQALMFDRVAAANGIRAAGADTANELTAQAVSEHGDTIITGWAEALTPDAATLADAAERLDLASLTAGDMHDLSRKKLLGVWADATAAADRFKLALDGWRAIASASQMQRQRDHDALILTDAPQSTIDAARSTGRDLNAWALARVGAPLRLATLTDYMQRVSRYVAEQQQRQRDLEAKRNAAGIDPLPLDA